MQLSQLEYIIAVDNYRNFVKAAESCNVTQPTLSAMIQKLELELDITIFDRKAHPVVPTEVGRKVIDQAKIVLFNTSQLHEIVLGEKGQNKGTLKLSIIPTIAPYILPKLFGIFKEEYPKINLHIFEMRTSIVIEKLRKAEIDMAILATPLEQEDLLEVPLYYEPFSAYISPKESIYLKDEIFTKDLKMDKMWVLPEGHCLRKQVFNFCNHRNVSNSIYEAGSIDTLIKIVDNNGGYTIIPDLHINFLSEEQKKNIRPLSAPVPVREVSIVIRQDYVKEKLINIVADSVKKIIPESMIDSRLKKFAIKL